MIAPNMETGHRVDAKGAVIPRDIINRFVCTYNGEEVFSADLFPAIAANPFLAFTLSVLIAQRQAATDPVTQQRRNAEQSHSEPSRLRAARMPGHQHRE